MPAELEAPTRKAKRTDPASKTAPDKLEAALMREVGDLLARHPRVLWAIRQNSGSAWMPGKGGVMMPVQFYRWVRSKTKMRVTDYIGQLDNGRFFALEVKRRSWKVPIGDRENEQLEFLLTVGYSGGIGSFVTSAEQVMELFK